MEWRDWLALIQTVVMAAASAVVWLLGRERELRDQEVRHLREDLAKVDLERLREIFISQERADDMIRESRTDRQALWEENRRLRTLIEKLLRGAGES